MKHIEQDPIGIEQEIKTPEKRERTLVGQLRKKPGHGTFKLVGTRVYPVTEQDYILEAVQIDWISKDSDNFGYSFNKKLLVDPEALYYCTSLNKANAISRFRKLGFTVNG